MLRLEHVGAGCRCSRLILGATQCSWRVLLLTGALAQPVSPILPPGACAFLCPRKPLFGISRVALIDEVRRLRIPWWIQKGLDVAAVTQDKRDLAPKQLRGRIAALPRRDVIGDACDEIGIVGHFGEINRRPQHLERAGMGKRIGFVQVEQLAMQFGGQTGRVVIPVEHIEGRRVVADQVVIDPIVPDQIVGAQPGEHACHFLTLDHPSQARGLPGSRDRFLRGKQPHRRLDVGIEHRHQERHGVNALVPRAAR